jgi:hypothetical protein
MYRVEPKVLVAEKTVAVAFEVPANVMAPSDVEFSVPVRMPSPVMDTERVSLPLALAIGSPPSVHESMPGAVCENEPPLRVGLSFQIVVPSPHAMMIDHVPSNGFSSVLESVKCKVPVFAELPVQEVALQLPVRVSERGGLPPFVDSVPVIAPVASIDPWKRNDAKLHVSVGSAITASLNWPSKIWTLAPEILSFSATPLHW